MARFYLLATVLCFTRRVGIQNKRSSIQSSVEQHLVQKLPSGVYVDGYQLRRDTGLEVLLDSEVDLEAPEYVSSGFTALVFLSGTHAHGRYHRPSDSSKTWSRPECSSDQTSRTLAPGVRGVVVEAPCTVSNHSICSWMEILDLEGDAGVSLALPVADPHSVCGDCADRCTELCLPALKHLEARQLLTTG